MPVDAVVVDGRPGLTWMDMSDVELKEPFFQQTVDRVRDEEPWRDAGLFTQFDALLQLDQVLPRIHPSGFIFHSSRCGSTLVANACRALDDAIVLSEANPIDKLVARFITDGADPVKESLYSVLLRAVVNALAYSNSENEPRVFVKFSCCGVSQLERVRRIWPDVPWIFLYRDPVETIVSNMMTVPAWLLDEDRRILAHITRTTPGAVAEMSLEERCARSIGSFYATAHSLANSNSMLLNYNQLSLQALISILEFFQVSPSPEELERITSGSRIYSKEALGAREFVPDADAKQKSASDEVRQFAQQFAVGAYNLLERGEKS